jgi:CubicO group peptidase (beta-lactamase class C family)
MRPALIFQVLVLALLMPGPAALAAAEPVYSATGPDAVVYGADRSYPLGVRGVRPAPVNMVANFSGFDRLYPHHSVNRPPQASVLRRAAADLTLTYRYQGNSYSLGDYLDRNPTTGLLIARGDTILFEHYRYARTDKDRFLSQSMAKTVTGMLVGIAVAEGKIRSIDQPAADYVPDLAGTEYGKTSIRDLLHMASGVAFTETYDGTDDSAKMSRMLFGPRNPGTARVLAEFNTREAPPGTRFHYAGAETAVLGLVVGNAGGMSLSRYLETRVWQPMGAEADATWTIDTSGRETAYCCFNAVLRDWARLGLLLAHDGAWNKRQIVPQAWVREATTVAAPFLAPGTATRGDGYGYQVWLPSGPRRQFAFRGIHGQAVLVDPDAKLVLVHTAVRLKPSGDPAALELMALWRALVAGGG